MNVPVRDVTRQKGTPCDELDLGNPKWTGEELIDFMMQHPILINRPIVITPLGTRLCRPSESVLDLLLNPQKEAFAKEDGEKVIDAYGARCLIPPILGSSSCVDPQMTPIFLGMGNRQVAKFGCVLRCEALLPT